MGSLRIFKYLSFQRVLTCSNSFTPSVSTIQSRSYAIFPDSFIHPIFREEDQRKLQESGEASKYAYLPVKPARTTETASVFYDGLVDKVINHIMRMGNKELARSIMDKTFMTIKKVQLAKYYDTEDPQERAKIILNPWELLHRAVENSKPFLETTPIKRGGHTYQVPVPVRENKQQALAIKWLIEAGKEKEDEMRFFVKFGYEIIDAANGTGQVIKRKQELHKKCEANRAYAHYRWS